MVRSAALALALASWTLLWASGVGAVPPAAPAPRRTPTPDGLPLLPPAPAKPRLAHPAGWETFTVVTLLSAPFTALWCGLVAGIAESIAQRRIPPKFGTPQYAIVAAAAGAASVGIALVSLDWGPAGRPPTSGSPKSTPTPTPTVVPAAEGRHG